MSAIITQFFLKNRHRIPVFFSVAALFFISNVSYAFASNPGATCPSGFAQGSLTNSDYTKTKLLTSLMPLITAPRILIPKTPSALTTPMSPLYTVLPTS